MGVVEQALGLSLTEAEDGLNLGGTRSLRAVGPEVAESGEPG